ncbi:hypothetical protein BG006_001808 [Podila minutissima]|uniref:DOMON domain-containing protein n=1 Tax=Podila minutissima TaxID=64525 RepID=A0A9P5SR19_9FUNG|nr:hypothetical protein BG006_001808 [Podila minutissima]
MIRVPVVNGVALAQDSHEGEDSGGVRTTGPWVELDHQDALEALKKDHINDPQHYSHTTETKPGEHKIDEATTQEPVAGKALISGEQVTEKNAEAKVAKKHHPTWLDFGDMESDLGVLMSFKAADSEVEKSLEQPVAEVEGEAEKENEVELTKEVDSEEEPNKVHSAWLDFFSIDSDMGVLASFRAAVDEGEGVNEPPRPAADSLPKGTVPGPESKQQTTLDVSDIVAEKVTDAIDHPVDATVDEEPRPQEPTTSTPSAQEFDLHHYQDDGDEETDNEDDTTSNGKNVDASVEINRTPLKGQAVLKNHLNKNDDHFDHDQTLSDRELEIRKGAIRLGKHHHHHITSKRMSELESEFESPEYSLQQQQQQQQQQQELHLEGTPKILLETREGEAQQASPPPLVIPDTILHRGLVPSVQGGHHCTPQFCVNTTLSPDGRFATFHIERNLAATGWISLGIGYAMTMADLIILWPNPTAEHPRGAVLSRRTSHAYVEPQLVGHALPGRDGIKADSASEANLYPANEYILHNTVPVVAAAGGAAPAVAVATGVFPDKKFIVQFTRPVKIRNRAFKLTPGQTQDFCWAYSPNPISPDSVGDPGAHIDKHFSVGSFAMDVGANQPQLKEVVAQLRKEDEREEAEEQALKAKELEESNRRLAEEEAAEYGEEGWKEVVVEEQHAGKVSSSAADSFALQGLSCLTALAVLYLFR